MIKTQFKLNRQFIQFLFWLGPSFVVMGLSAGVVIGSWEPIPLILIITGFVILGLWFLFQAYFKPQGKSETPYWSRRSTQAGN
ncbi:MAG: hypothetical protein RSE13_18605 [Planktothrix sp. GU0601_MAG3]|nr:MAG: hypothetical protein RSE13_18605 [Planktothrix sp. GU0601_MAG3]